MKSINRLMTVFVICLLPFSSLTIVKAEGNDEKIDLSKYNTTENPMPISTNNDEVNGWINETTDYLEKYYNQEIISVNETKETIAFFFKIKPLSAEEQVESIEYYKPNNSTKASTGDYKLTTYSAWSNGAEPVSVQTRTASNIAAAAGIVISLIPSGAETQILSTLVNAVMSYCAQTIDDTLPVKGRTEAAVKYKRKIGNYYMRTGVWWANVEIGRVEYWYYKTAYQPKYKNGPYVPHHQDRVPNAAEDNYNKSYNKTHYTDNTWIKNKSLALKDTGNTYYDIFG